MRCWKCNKEFYSEYLSQTLCDECLAKIPKTTATTETTATTDFVNLLNTEMYELKISGLEAKLAEQQECSLKESAKHNLEMQNAQICVKELEAKLAESEKKFNVANNLRKKSDEVLLNYKTEKYGLDKTIQELRKMKLSLPEKEWYYKGFENCERQMSSHIADLTLEFKELKQQLAEKEKELEQYKNNWYIDIDSLKIDENVQKIANQKAICELEKVRNNIKKVPITDYEPNEHFEKMYKSDAIRQIDNQIKLLKEGKL